MLLVAPARGRRRTHLEEFVSLLKSQAFKIEIEGVVFTKRGGPVPRQSWAQRRRLVDDTLAHLEPTARKSRPRVRLPAAGDHGSYATGSLDLLKNSS